MERELIIFDCDGVLVDSEAIGNRVMAKEIIKLGIPITIEEAIKKFAGGSMHQTLAYIEKQLGKPVPETFESNYRQKSFEAFQRELQPIEGIRTIISRLEHPFCVASNGPRVKIEQNLTITSLIQYFKGNIFSADDIKNLET